MSKLLDGDVVVGVRETIDLRAPIKVNTIEGTTWYWLLSPSTNKAIRKLLVAHDVVAFMQP